LAILTGTSWTFATEVEMKTVHVDKFFAGQLQPLPLKWKIPKAYVYAEGLDVDETYSYWMQPNEIKAAISNKDLPGKAAQFLFCKIGDQVWGGLVEFMLR
jgi:hypothetical protein